MSTETRTTLPSTVVVGRTAYVAPVATAISRAVDSSAVPPSGTRSAHRARTVRGLTARHPDTASRPDESTLTMPSPMSSAPAPAATLGSSAMAGAGSKSAPSTVAVPARGRYARPPLNNVNTPPRPARSVARITSSAPLKRCRPFSPWYQASTSTTGIPSAIRIGSIAWTDSRN